MKINVLWMAVPTVLFLAMTALWLDKVLLINNKVKPYVKEQDEVIAELVKDIQQANSNINQQNQFILTNMKGAVNGDQDALRRLFFEFKPTGYITPPEPPKQIEF